MASVMPSLLCMATMRKDFFAAYSYMVKMSRVRYVNLAC